MYWGWGILYLICNKWTYYNTGIHNICSDLRVLYFCTIMHNFILESINTTWQLLRPLYNLNFVTEVFN
jgi:hypothetical protein